MGRGGIAFFKWKLEGFASSWQDFLDVSGCVSPCIPLDVVSTLQPLHWTEDTSESDPDTVEWLCSPVSKATELLRPAIGASCRAAGTLVERILKVLC